MYVSVYYIPEQNILKKMKTDIFVNYFETY